MFCINLVAQAKLLAIYSAGTTTDSSALNTVANIFIQNSM